MGAPDLDLIVEQLDIALRALLGARVAAAQSLPQPALPEEALDLALQHNEAYQAARRGVSEALAAVEAVLGQENRSLVFDLEGAVNAALVQAAEVAWALAWAALRTAR
ncbi:MAG: hypothetical protein AMXMBFR58_36550 [Phycisphaerae bacterium]